MDPDTTMKDTTSTVAVHLSGAKNATTATPEELAAARRIVDSALDRSAELNKARLARPARNRYRLKPGTVVGGRGKVRRREIAVDEEPPPPLLEITPEIAATAALISEVEAQNMSATSIAGNLTRREPAAPATGSFWMESIPRKGTVPWGGDASYKVCSMGMGTALLCV
jgi:hypothetical protein